MINKEKKPEDIIQCYNYKGILIYMVKRDKSYSIEFLESSDQYKTYKGELTKDFVYNVSNSWVNGYIYHQFIKDYLDKNN
jgi:hypothetical protein